MPCPPVRPTLPRPRSASLLATLLLVLLAVGSSPAAAQQDPFQADLDSARASVREAQAAAHEANRKLETTRARQSEVEAQVADVTARVAELSARIPALEAEVARLRATVRERTAVLYRTSGPYAPGGNPLDVTTKALRRRQLAAALAKHDEEQIDQLNAAVAQLGQLKEQLAREQADLVRQQDELRRLTAELVAQQGELERKVAHANDLLAQAEARFALSRQGNPIYGQATLTAAQMVAWYRAQGYTPRLATTIEDLAQIFLDEGRAEGVRGDMAFAQSIVETGGFNAAPANNYAGMGWCDSCSTGTRFPTPRDGVRAQIQHLKNYADRSSRASGLANPPSPYWYGSDPARARTNFDTFFAKGWAPTWNDMGRGNWATDPNYASKVLRVYQSMSSFAQSR